MFANVTDGRGLSDYDELHLFHSHDLKTGWQPHACNPVISDVTCARPAGAILRNGNQMLRPSQDSRKIYGHGLVINEITTLTVDAYAERTLHRLLPGSDAVWQGIHTLNTTGKLSAIDLLLPHQQRSSSAEAPGSNLLRAS